MKKVSLAIFYLLMSFLLFAQSLPRGLTYSASANSITITRYDAALGGRSHVTSLIIPAEIEGLPVTSIARYAFESINGLASVTLPNSITTIGDGAFFNCRDLSRINIPSSVVSIGGSAFAGTKITNIEIPDSVTTMGNSVFSRCIDLVSVNIPPKITSIGNSTFFDCRSLTNIIIPNNVTSIGAEAFQGCINLTSIIIPNSVTNIGGGAFANCSNLISVTLGTISERNFGSIAMGTSPFDGNLKLVYFDTSGGPGTYIRNSGGQVWRKQQ